MKILVTGGAGYIGSHTVVELLNASHEAVVVDNLSNSKAEAVRRVEEITGKSVIFYEEDILNEKALKEIFLKEQPEAVIHFAALKAVGESVAKPLEYYQNNITGTLTVLRVMRDCGCKKFVFSSSATVYGDPHTVPIKEDFPLSATNPYGQTKLMNEQILRDAYKADSEWSIALLRYFNPVGAHKSGRIGEDPAGIPNNLVPYITQVAIGKREALSVFGDDYPTPDGTGVRDYIHVVDLAKGHLKAIEALDGKTGVLTVNLGTGRGYSVLEMLHAFEKAVGHDIPYKIAPRRPGDIAECYADPSYAYEVLGWKAELGLEEMCEDSWRWQSANPNGYND
ncbi:MAG: UDP-glucose 4-epimerase GalE [Clostridiales bacterium]|jgi:UDP-glucose 4-epimerase|nr:UDP-glucose 4-epimerase GalE [Clostridiales bacterium]